MPSIPPLLLVLNDIPTPLFPRRQSSLRKQLQCKNHRQTLVVAILFMKRIQSLRQALYFSLNLENFRAIQSYAKSVAGYDAQHAFRYRFNYWPCVEVMELSYQCDRVCTVLVLRKSHSMAVIPVDKSLFSSCDLLEHRNVPWLWCFAVVVVVFNQRATLGSPSSDASQVAICSI